VLKSCENQFQNTYGRRPTPDDIRAAGLGPFRLVGTRFVTDSIAHFQPQVQEMESTQRYDQESSCSTLPITRPAEPTSVIIKRTKPTVPDRDAEPVGAKVNPFSPVKRQTSARCGAHISNSRTSTRHWPRCLIPFPSCTPTCSAGGGPERFVARIYTKERSESPSEYSDEGSLRGEEPLLKALLHRPRTEFCKRHRCLITTSCLSIHHLYERRKSLSHLNYTCSKYKKGTSTIKWAVRTPTFSLSTLLLQCVSYPSANLVEHFSHQSHHPQ
jgi:hypothetical protein